MTTNSYEEYQKMINSIQFGAHKCPLRACLDALQGKWSLRILFELSKCDTMRFGELKKQVGIITNTMLTNTLRNLEENKLITRIQYNEIPPHVEYALSDAGKALYPVFLDLVRWEQTYLADKEQK